MLFVYLDEFGHIGPFAGRRDPIHNTSPVFGVAGLILPEPAIRPFATKMLQLKQHLFGQEIGASGLIPQKWEKKGASIFRPRSIERYQELRRGSFRLLNGLRECDGKVFYYGREKIVGITDGNANGLYTTVFAHAIRQINAYAASIEMNFAIVLDEHSARKELLETAAKTMYGAQPARQLVSPPFEVESYLDQNMQAADWIAAIVGRLWAYECQPEQYDDHLTMRNYYWSRIHQVATHSTVVKRARRESVDPPAQLTRDAIAERLTRRFSVTEKRK